jgi:hypothetical protein
MTPVAYHTTAPEEDIPAADNVESDPEEEVAVEVDEDEPIAPWTRRLPARFEGMVNERAKLPNGRYKHKPTPSAYVDAEVEQDEPVHGEEENEPEF